MVLEAVFEVEGSDESFSRILGAMAPEEVVEVEGEPAGTEGIAIRTTMGMDAPSQHINQHPPYLHRPVLAAEAALVVA